MPGHDGKPASDRTVAHYEKEVTDLKPPMRELLQNWSGIPADEVEKYVFEMREQAWDIHPYPCIGQWGFLNLSISQLPSYPEILQRVKDGDKLLDIGCCFAQDLRKLANDGAPTGNLYGFEMRQAFVDLGYEFFRDRDRMHATFLVGDALDSQSPIQQLEGQMSVIHAGSFFHLFTRDEQIQLKKRVVSLLKPEKGVMIVGRQVGNLHPGEQPWTERARKRVWRHDPTTFRQMWDEVGRATGTEWDVQVDFVESARFAKRREVWGKAGEDSRLLRFAVRRR